MQVNQSTLLPPASSSVDQQSSASTPQDRSSSDQSMRASAAPTRLTPGKLLLLGAAVLSRAPTAESLCKCLTYENKVYWGGESTSAMKVPVRHGCIDQPLVKEVDKVEIELRDFISFTFSDIDEEYFQPNFDLLKELYIAGLKGETGGITQEDRKLYTEILAAQRNAMSEGLEDRELPDPAKGSWTTTPFKDVDLQLYKDWKKWDIEEYRDAMICTSPELMDELERLKDDNTPDRNIRLDRDLGDADLASFVDSLNEYIDVHIAENEARHNQLHPEDSDKSFGLSKFTKRAMEVVLSQVNDTPDNVGFGIVNGKQFASLFLERLLVEPPNVTIPQASLQKETLDLGDTGKDPGKGDCLPLTAFVLQQREDGEGNIGYSLTQMGDLAIGDQIVVGSDENGIVTSTVNNFAHRLDDRQRHFVHAVYFNQDNSAHLGGNSTDLKAISANAMTMMGTTNHNIEYGVTNPETGNIESRHQTYSKMMEAVENNEDVFIKSGQGEWMPVGSASYMPHEGVVAPITDAGTIMHVPPQIGYAGGQEPMSEEAALEIIGKSAVSSVYSSVPDWAGKIVSDARWLFGPSLNEHGVGSGPVFDTLMELGNSYGRFVGHQN